MLTDIVIGRYNGKMTRAQRMAVRFAARKEGVTEWEIVIRALLDYEPVERLLRKDEG